MADFDEACRSRGASFPLRALAWVPVLGLALLLAAHGVALAAGGMARAVAWPLVIQLVPIAAGFVGVLTLVIVLFRRRIGRVTGATLAVSLLGALPGLVGFGVVSMAYPASLESTSPAAHVRLPTDQPMIVGWGGDDVATNYHAADPAQRWAYDLLVAPAGHGASALTDYGCYGVPVLAPADGRVSHVEDGHPEQLPNQYTPNWQHPAGNMVAIRLRETGTHLVLAHFQPGSVRVSRGDEVREGQVLGLCGSSGNSSEPHVHLHHQRQDPAVLGLLGEGLPLYFRDHDGEPMPRGGVEIEDDRIRWRGAVVQHRATGD